MKTKIINAVCKVRFLAVLLLLTFAYASAWATDCQLKVWDKSKNAYVTWRTISDGYVFGTHDFPYYDSGSQFYTVIAWTNAEYNSTYPSNNYYYYDTQTYGKTVNGSAYKPTTLYAVYQTGTNSYSSAPDYQLNIPKYMITYRLTGLELTSGPRGINSTGVGSFTSEFEYESGYGGTVTGTVTVGSWPYTVTYGQWNGISGGDADFTLGTLRYNAGEIDDDVIVTLTATELSCVVLSTPTSLKQNTRYDDSGTTKVRCQWSCASDVTTHATNLKFSYGLMGESAINTWDNVTKTATQWKYARSSLSSGWYWWKIQALGDGDDYCDSEIATSSFCIDDVDVSTPSGLSFSPTSSSTGTLSWTAMSGAAGYLVTVKNSGTPIAGFNEEMVDGTSINVTGLSVGVTYDVVLQAYNNCSDLSLENTSFSFTITEYTVHWYVNGELWEGVSHGSPATSVLAGNRPSPLPTAPTSDDFCGDKFMGWTYPDPIEGSGGQPARLFNSTAPVVNSNINFYAVFADENP